MYRFDPLFERDGSLLPARGTKERPGLPLRHREGRPVLPHLVEGRHAVLPVHSVQGEAHGRVYGAGDIR